MWLTEAQIERGGRAGGPAAKTGGEEVMQRVLGSPGLRGSMRGVPAEMPRCQGGLDFAGGEQLQESRAHLRSRTRCGTAY